MTDKQLVSKALAVRSAEQADDLQSDIERAIGHRRQRWVADRTNNFGVISGAGTSFDLRVIEQVTNATDSILERAARAKWGSLDQPPYRTPKEAAEDLFPGVDYQELADKAVVEFFKGEEEQTLTITVRDRGCGLTADQMPDTIFFVGSSHKESVLWMQGAFGLGGAMTYRNARAVVVVSRRAPELLEEGDEDCIAVAVVQWERHVKGEGAFYLVAERNVPYSVPASACPEFEAGTYVALISYAVEGFHRKKAGDERTFDTVADTRLFAPILPIRYTNHTYRSKRRTYLRGLGRRLRENPRPDRETGSDTLPFRHDGQTFHLPVTYYLFSKRGEKGERRNFVAHNHCVLFTSNGQVHHHWTPAEFRLKCGLNKLYGRILVVVETDELPIEVRTQLFTADRSQLLGLPNAIRLEDQVAAFLKTWQALVSMNNDLIRESLASSDPDQATLGVAQQISRALQVRGFSLPGVGPGTAGGHKKDPPPPEDLYPDPTTLEGPDRVVAPQGTTKFVNYVVNATDDFIPSRAQLQIECDHPDIGSRDITVGQLRSGRIRASIVVPLDAKLGEHRLTVRLNGWLRSAGGLGAPLSWTTTIEVVDEVKSKRPVGGRKGSGKGKAREGNLVALVWTDHEKEEDWTKSTIGEVRQIEARTLANLKAEYSELAGLGDAKVPTIHLNQQFPGLKNYLAQRGRDLVDLGPVKNRYAVGAGVGLVVLHLEQEKRQAKGESISDEWVKSAQLALGKSTLSMMPAYDQLAKEAGIED